MRTRLAALAAVAVLAGPVLATPAGARECDPHTCQAECQQTGLNGYCILDTGDCMCLRPGR